MLKVFISYRREDSIDVSGRIYDWMATRLPEDGVFIDVDSIVAGADFRDALAKMLDQTGIVLAVIGQKWLDVTDSSGRRRLDNPEDIVRMEIVTALQRNIPVVPILIQGAKMPSAQLLSPWLAPLAYRNALEVRPNPDFTRDMERVAKAIEFYVPDMAFASNPIPGRSPNVTRGASLPSTQASSASVPQIAPPIVPVSLAVTAVRSIRYPWFVRRLVYAHILTAIGFIPYILVVGAHVAGVVCTDQFDNQCYNDGPPQVAVRVSAIIGAPFWAVAAIILISLFGYALTILVRQRRWRWFGVVLALVLLVVVLYPVLGLWAFGLFGPTTPAPPKPAGKRAKG